MKVLLLLRHGEAEFSSANGDYDRSLTENGKSQIVRVGNQLIKNQLMPQMIVSSPAQRTKETVVTLCGHILFDESQVVYESVLYHQGVEAYLNQIVGIDDRVEVLLMIGHNPSISHLVDYLSKDDSMCMATGSLVAFAFDMHSWGEIYSCSSINKIMFH